MSRWQSLVKFVSLTPDLPLSSRATTPDAIRSVEILGPLGQRAADWSSIRDGERVRDTWAKCATAYACLTLLADAVAESPLRVYQDVQGEPEERPDHRVRTLLANPNPVMSEAEFMVLTVMTMGLFGYSVTEKVRSGAGLPVELWPLRPDWLIAERRNDGGVRYMYRRPQTDPREIERDDLIFTPYYHDPSQVRPGISPLHIVAREAGIDVALTDLLKVFIDAGGIPPWAVEIPDSNPDQAQVDMFREKWRQKYGGSQAYGNIAVLYGGMKLTKVGDSVGDMAWPELRAITEQKIAQAFRVPLDLIQGRDAMKSGSLTTTEMEGAMSYLQNHGAQPLRMRIDGAFTRGLLADFTGGDSRFSLEFDTSAIMALQENRDALHTRVRADWDSGLITMNEARVETGRPDLGRDGDVIKLPFTATLTPIGDLAGGASTVMQGNNAPTALVRAREPLALTKGRVYRDLKALSPAELETRASVLATTRRERDKLEQIATRKLKRYFRDQRDRVLGSLPKSDRAAEIKADSINWDNELELLRAILEQFYGVTGERTFASVSATVGVEVSWSLFNPRIRDLMDELGTRIVGIHEETRKQVADTITQAMSEGANLQEIADRLTEKYDEFSGPRSMTIGRTESAHAMNKASGLAYAESGVVSTVELVDNESHDTDPLPPTDTTCADRSQLVVRVDEIPAYTDSMHPNCIMAVIPLLDRPLGEV